MLANFIEYSNEFNEIYKRKVTSKRLLYYWTESYVNLTIEPSKDTWQKIQKVSITPTTKEVIGFIEADINRGANFVSNLSFFSFKSGKGFKKDLYIFINELFSKYCFNKIVYNCVVGNPFNYFNEQLAKDFRAEKVGTFKNHKMLQNGAIYDQTFYEIYRWRQ